MVFYRKYRPQKFADIVGQHHIVQTLTNALEQGQFSHGYLLAGPRGSGKTTLARICAKALNCTGRTLGKDSFEPCNKCNSCKEISAGKSLDMIEIDAASNRGIDEIRDLREKIKFAPTSATYKIYIIDEVHMLTKEAFNALLKTLEEPPQHAIFLMATTEPQKVLSTILSRVQRFDFHRADLSEIKKLLNRIISKESLKIDDEAIHLLAQLSFGSYRDALSLLGQVATVRKTAASKITLEQVQELLGISGEKSVFDFIVFLSEKNRPKAFETISQLYLQGIDLENFAVKVVEVLRKIALYKFGENQLFDLTHEQQEEAKRIAASIEIDFLMKMIEKFALAIPKIKAAPLPQLPLEMLVYEFTNDADKGRGDALSEMPVDERSVLPRLGNEAKQEVRNRMARAAESEGRPEAINNNLSQDLWVQIIKEAKTHNNHIAALLKDAVLAGTDDGTITLAFKFKFHADMVSGKRNTQIIEEIINKITGSQYKLTCIVNPALVIKSPVEQEEELLNGAKEVFDLS